MDTIEGNRLIAEFMQSDSRPHHLDKPRPFFSMPGVRDGDSRFYSPTHYAKMPSSYIDVTPETK